MVCPPTGSLTLSAAQQAAMLAGFESDTLQQIQKSFDGSDYIADESQSRLQALFDAGVETSEQRRTVFDETYFGMLRASLLPYQGATFDLPLEISLRGIACLFEGEGDGPHSSQITVSTVGELSNFGPAAILNNLSYDYELADRVLEVALPYHSFEEVFETFMNASEPVPRDLLLFSMVGAYAYLGPLSQIWYKQFGMSLIIHDQEQDRFVIRFPSISLVEAIGRTLYGPEFKLNLIPGELEPEVYDALWESGHRLLGLPVKPEYFSPEGQVDPPLVLIAHEFFHLGTNLSDTELERKKA